MPVAVDITSRDGSLSSALATIFRGKLCDNLVRNRNSVTFHKGEALFDVGDEERMFFFVQRGVVKIGTVTAQGGEVVYDLRKQGDIVGELSAFEEPRRDRAVALEEVEAVAVGYDEILETVQKNREFLRELLQVFCASLSDAYDQINSVSFDNTVQRVVKVLLKLTSQFGRPAEQGIEIATYFTQEEIAQMVAARRERVSTALNLLRSRGVVHYSRGGHLVVDVQALENYGP